MKRVGIGVAAAALLSLTACGGEDTFTASGVVGLTQPDGFTTKYDNSCEGKGGFDDIREGADVVIYAADGKKVGLGQLSSGAWKPDKPCVFTFKVEDVPASGDIYSVEVSHRGQVSFKQAESGSISLSVG